MKVLMTADPVGGVWRYALELCEALECYGAEVLLATLGGELAPWQRMEVSELRNVRCCESRFRLEWMESPWQSLEWAGNWLLALEESFEPSVIHLNHLVHGDLRWNAPVLVSGHSCVLSWWQAVRGGECPHGTWDRYRERVTQSLQAADLVVAPTSAMMRALEQRYGPLPVQRVIANGLNAGRFHSVAKEPLILTAGRLWDAGKNVQTLCAAAPAVSWPIFVAGAATSPDGAHQAVKSVCQLGDLSPRTLAQWYARAAIYALPARYEPFGLTALEAALCGCALVLGDIDSLREVWGDAARYVPTDDPNALSAALNELIADPEALCALARAARARARHYTAERFADQYWTAYTGLLESKEGSPCASYSSITL